MDRGALDAHFDTADRHGQPTMIDKQAVFAHECVMSPFPVFANSAMAATVKNAIHLSPCP